MINFEEALSSFFDSQNECSAMCEGEFDGGADFLARKSFHDHFVGNVALFFIFYFFQYSLCNQ